MKTESIVEDKLRVAVLRAAQMLIDLGLGDWKIKLNKKTKSLAETWHAEKTIAYSKLFITVADKEQFEGVTLHEATHALLGPGFGHGWKFVKKCKEISPNGDYAKKAADVPIRKYTLTCPSCGISGSHNSNRERFCGVCFEKGITAAFVITENNLAVKEWA